MEPTTSHLPSRPLGFVPSSPEPWVSVDEVATHLGVVRESVYRWIETKGLPATKLGKLWKLKLSEVDAWMRAGGLGPNHTGGPK